MTIGNRISALRKEHSYSQEYVASRLGVSRQAVSKWETDQSAPDTYNLIALAELFNVSVEYLKGETDIREKEKTPTNVGEGEQELFELWNNVPVEKREAFIKLFKALLDTL